MGTLTLTLWRSEEQGRVRYEVRSTKDEPYGRRSIPRAPPAFYPASLGMTERRRGAPAAGLPASGRGGGCSRDQAPAAVWPNWMMFAGWRGGWAGERKTSSGKARSTAAG